MLEVIEQYVRGLGLDAYLVGGAVRDELLGLDSQTADFLVPGVDTDELKRRLAPHGRVEDLVVAGRLVGVRLYPKERSVRPYARAGIEFAPPRKEVSTGPGRHDFEIVADPSLPVSWPNAGASSGMITSSTPVSRASRSAFAGPIPSRSFESSPMPSASSPPPIRSAETSRTFSAPSII